MYQEGAFLIQHLFACFRVQSFSFVSSDTIDMPFKITVVDEFGQNVLHKGGNGAGVKAELLGEAFCEMAGQHHVSDSERGRDGF